MLRLRCTEKLEDKLRGQGVISGAPARTRAQRVCPAADKIDKHRTLPLPLTLNLNLSPGERTKIERKTH